MNTVKVFEEIESKLNFGYENYVDHENKKTKEICTQTCLGLM